MTPFEKLILRYLHIRLASLRNDDLDRWEKEGVVLLMGDIRQALDHADDQEKLRDMTRY